MKNSQPQKIVQSYRAMITDNAFCSDTFLDDIPFYDAKASYIYEVFSVVNVNIFDLFLQP